MIPERRLSCFLADRNSTTCLAWALDRFETVETVGFAYGQRHAIELACREPVREALRQANPGWAERLGSDQVIDLGVLGEVSESALTKSMEIALTDEGLPTTFVPGRNLVFLDFRRDHRVSSRRQAHRRRYVRNRFLRLPGLPR